MEMQENAGHVSRGLSKAETDKIPSKMWFRGKTKNDNCTICMGDYSAGDRYKIISKCAHEFHA